MEIAVQILLNAVIAGAIYSMVALGFTLIYSAARFFDLGYGALAAAGGYAVFYFYKELGLNLPVSLLLSVGGVALLGLLIDRVIYRQLRKRKASGTVLLVASLGVLTVLQAIIAIIFTSQFQTLSRDIGAEKIFTIMGGVMTETQLIILGASLTVMILLALALKYTLFGKAVRAVADDSEVANIVGIPSERILAAVFFIGSAIAALAGISIGFDTGIQPVMGMGLLLKGVVAAIIGGIGNIYGAVIGAFLLAVIENLGAWHFAGEWKDAIAFGVLIVFLLFRPQGLLGKK